jgi:hypothetical protein
MKESFSSCSDYDFNLALGFDDSGMNKFQKVFGNIPYDSQTFTGDFKRAFREKCRELIPHAQTHHIFENYVLKALNTFNDSSSTYLGFERFTLNILRGEAISSSYSVDEGKTTGTGEVVYSVVYSTHQRWENKEETFEFTVINF